MNVFPFPDEPTFVVNKISSELINNGIEGGLAKKAAEYALEQTLKCWPDQIKITLDPHGFSHDDHREFERQINEFAVHVKTRTEAEIMIRLAPIILRTRRTL